MPAYSSPTFIKDTVLSSDKFFSNFVKDELILDVWILFLGFLLGFTWLPVIATACCGHFVPHNLVNSPGSFI